MDLKWCLELAQEGSVRKGATPSSFEPEFWKNVKSISNVFSNIMIVPVRLYIGDLVDWVWIYCILAAHLPAPVPPDRADPVTPCPSVTLHDGYTYSLLNPVWKLWVDFWKSCLAPWGTGTNSRNTKHPGQLTKKYIQLDLFIKLKFINETQTMKSIFKGLQIEIQFQAKLLTKRTTGASRKKTLSFWPKKIVQCNVLLSVLCLHEKRFFYMVS